MGGGKGALAFYGLPAWKHPWVGAYVQELRDPSEQKGEGLPGLRGICRWSPGDFVAAGTQGRGGRDGR